MPERDLHLEVTTDSDSKGLTEAAKDTEKLRDQVKGLGGDMASTRKESEKLGAEVDKTRAKIKDLGAEFARTGDKSLFGDLRSERAYLAQIEKIRKELDKVDDITAAKVGLPLGGMAAGGGLLGAIPDIGGVPGPAVAGIAAAAAAATPLIGATIAAAVLGGVGTGGVIGGVMLAAQDTRVRSAWSAVGNEVFTELGDAAVSFVEPLTRAADQFREDWSRDAGLVKQIFTDLAPTIEPLAKGLTGFLHELGPGLEKAAKASVPLASKFGQELTRFGEATSTMLSDIADAEPGAELALHDLFTVIDSGVEGLGRATKALSGIYDLMHKIPLTNLSMQVAFQSTGLLDAGVQLVDLFGDQDAAVRDLTGANQAALSPAEQLSRKMDDQAEAARANAKAIEQVTKMVNEYYEAILLPLDAEERWEAAIDGVTDSVKENGRTLDVHTAAGRANRDAIEEAVSAAKHQLDVGQITEQQYLREIDYLERRAAKLGLNRAEVEKLVGAFKTLPSKLTTDYILSINGVGNAFQLLRQMMGRGVLPPLSMGEHSGSHGSAAPPTNINAHQQIPGLASGGSVLSSGIVDIHRDERVFLPRGAVVERASANSSGFTAAPLVLNGGGLGQLVFEWLREQIDNRGGSLAVLNLKAP